MHSFCCSELIIYNPLYDQVLIKLSCDPRMRNYFLSASNFYWNEKLYKSIFIYFEKIGRIFFPNWFFLIQFEKCITLKTNLEMKNSKNFASIHTA